MRRWIALFLIVLLPLRAWAGAAMPVQPDGANQVSSAKETAALLVASAGADQTTSTDHPCHGHMAIQAPSSDGSFGEVPQAGHPNGKGLVSHAACSACDVCHTVAIDMLMPSLLQPVESQVIAVTSTERFFSSDLRRDRKPPIV